MRTWMERGLMLMVGAAWAAFGVVLAVGPGPGERTVVARYPPGAEARASSSAPSQTELAQVVEGAEPVSAATGGNDLNLVLLLLEPGAEAGAAAQDRQSFLGVRIQHNGQATLQDTDNPASSVGPAEGCCAPGGSKTALSNSLSP